MGCHDDTWIDPVSRETGQSSGKLIIIGLTTVEVSAKF